MSTEVRVFRELLGNRHFSLFVFSDYLSSFGNIMTIFAIWSQVLLLTDNDPRAMGLVTLLEVLPGILIAPWAGILADRMSKRWMLIIAHLLRALTVGMMFFSTELWHLYVLACMHSMFGAFGEPSRKSLLPLLVKPEQYVTMNSFLATLNNILQIFRPAIGGLVVAAFGYKMGFAVNFFTYFVPMIALLFVQVKDVAVDRGTEEKGKKSSMWQDVREGMAYIRTEPILIYLFVFMMLLNLCLGTQGALTLVFVGENLSAAGEPSAVVGMLFSALGIGGLLGAVLTHRLIKKMSMLLLLFGSLAFDGVVVIVFAFSDTLGLAIACFALFGIIGSVNQIVQDTLIQTIVPEHLRGRVYGAFGPITGPITLLSIGSGTSLASVIGTRAVFFICGVLEVGCAGICRLLPTYQQVRRSLTEKMAEASQPASQQQQSTTSEVY